MRSRQRRQTRRSAFLFVVDPLAIPCACLLPGHARDVTLSLLRFVVRAQPAKQAQPANAIRLFALLHRYLHEIADLNKQVQCVICSCDCYAFLCHPVLKFASVLRKHLEPFFRAKLSILF
jgi:hypothetical protein